MRSELRQYLPLILTAHMDKVRILGLFETRQDASAPVSTHSPTAPPVAGYAIGGDATSC